MRMAGVVEGGMSMSIAGGKAGNSTRNTADYLAQLLMDKKQLTAFPHVFLHIDRILDEGI